MKKIFYTLIMLMLCTSMKAGVVTKTIWSEDFDDVNTIQGDFANSKFDVESSNYAWDEEMWAYAFGGGYAIGIYESGGPNGQALNLYNPNGTCANMVFGHDNNDISDNWTLSFDLWCNEVGNTFPKQLAITGSNLSANAIGDILSSNTFLQLNKTQEVSTNETYSIFNITLGSEEQAGTLRMDLGTFYRFKLTCTGANTNNATLSLKVTIIDTGATTYTATQENVNISSIGNLYSIYSYFYSDDADRYGTNQVAYDQFSLTKDVTVDDTPCQEPTYEITGANGNSRIFTLDCPTNGATIYYSETQLAVGDEGWTEYTSSVTTSAKTIYAYAYNSANETSSGVISFSTGAGSTIRLTAPLITKVSYDETKGYGFTLTPDFTSVAVVPTSYTMYYNINGGEKIALAEGEIAYAEAGSTIRGFIEADGYTKSSSSIDNTSTYPQVPVLWTQDFSNLVNASIYGTDAKNIVLTNSSTFNVETKSLFGIKQFVNGTQNININTDSRVGLTGSTYYKLQASNGIVSTKPDPTYEVYDDDDESSEEEDYLANEDGIGISNLNEGQYIFVTTTGGETNTITGCDKISGASTTSTQIYYAYSNTALINIPNGVSVKSIEVHSNKEYIKTNDNGIAVYVSSNPLLFDNSGAIATIVESEKRSGVFVQDTINEVPAGTPFILRGEANQTYEIELGTATQLQGTNLLTVSNNDITVSDYTKPIYVVNDNGEIVIAETNVIPAGTPYILSELDAAEYYDVTMNANGYYGLIYSKPLDFSETEGLEVYAITGEALSSGFERHLVTETNEIPAETAVILKGTPGTTYTMQVSTGTTPIVDNKLKGSTTTDFNVNDTVNAIYVLLDNGTLQLVDKSKTSVIPAGTIYLISRYRGFVQIETNAYGNAALTATQPMTFGEIALNAYIITGETASGVTPQPVSTVPAGTPFYVIGGKADSIYNIPISTASETLINNKLISLSTDFNAGDTINYIYAFDAEAGEMKKVDETYIIPAGEPFFISEYTRKIDLGVETVTLFANGRRTYITEKALDFDQVEGLRAFIATSATAAGVSTSEIHQVPAGTAVSLIGTANATYDIPVIESADKITINLLTGSRTESFDVNTVDKSVFIITPTCDGFIKADYDYVVPAGEAYVLTDYVNVERITTNAYGLASHISSHPLDFRGIDGIEVKIVNDETPYSRILKPIEQITTESAFFLRGEPNTTYTIPVGDCQSIGLRNRLSGSNSKSFDVSTAHGYVYILSDNTDSIGIEKVDESYIVPAGVAYFESDYRGFEEITTNAKGFCSHVAYNPLEINYVGDLQILVVNDEDIDSIYLKRAYELSEGDAFFAKGSPNTTYQIPIRYNAQAQIDNFLHGSNTETFFVGSEENDVYVLSSGKLSRVAKTVTIPAGKAYYISRYKGYESITIGSSGIISYITEHPLAFSEPRKSGLLPLICNKETEDSIFLKDIDEVPAGTALLIKGTPDSTYHVPIGTCESLRDGLENLFLGSRTETFFVGSVENDVYALSSGKLLRVAKTVTIPAGKAYLISKYPPTSANAKGIAIFRDDEEEDSGTATNVNEVNVEPQNNEHKFFNLAGQPVDENYKGIVIDETGKKYYRR